MAPSFQRVRRGGLEPPIPRWNQGVDPYNFRLRATRMFPHSGCHHPARFENRVTYVTGKAVELDFVQ